MSGIYLGVKTQNPVIGITSTNPATVQSMIDAQKASQQNVQNQNPAQQPPTVVHEMPWHKASPQLKNVK